jgi:predicted metal-dependent phosphoesterase TrpH
VLYNNYIQPEIRNFLRNRKVAAIMESIVDLHTHSTASDGSFTPKELVRLARDIGLSAVAITDHDTIDGIDEALEEGRLSGIEVVPGLEISVDFETEMHILGYFFGNNYLNMAPVLKELKEHRERRNPKIINRLKELGFDISLEEIEKKAGSKIISRPHIARALLEKGYVESINEAFEKYLARGRPAYFRKEKLLPEEAIKEIRRAGGLPVLAHPIYLGMDFGQLDLLLLKLKSYGLIGIEAYYSDNTVEDTVRCIELAEKHGLVATGGSDFHGRFKPDIRLGTGRGQLKVPYEALQQMKEALRHNTGF